MDERIKLTLLRALDTYKGDDLYRARIAFGGMSNEQMQEQHGNSGKTRAKVLREYEEYSERIEKARQWVEDN